MIYLLFILWVFNSCARYESAIKLHLSYIYVLGMGGRGGAGGFSPTELIQCVLSGVRNRILRTGRCNLSAQSQYIIYIHMDL